MRNLVPSAIIGAWLLSGCTPHPIRLTYNVLTDPALYSSNSCIDVSKINSIVITLSGPGGKQSKTFAKSNITSGKVTADYDMLPSGTYSMSGKALDASGNVIAHGPAVSFSDTSNVDYLLSCY
ncbi:MAG: hypothetical protein HY692_05860 [Cyanobacteria bacterium NC_groundwater_1444_Ag_S-0.65um_54_12]|nr:hypothetical protein [Cyanobacteria bacterium NC_groundwater_1444_Ag_S-0.65um_54_12]